MKTDRLGVPLKVAAYVLVVLLLSFADPAVGAQQVIMFASNVFPLHSQLFIANGDGTGERPLLPLTGMDYSPSISPDGEWVIFTSERIEHVV